MAQPETELVPVRVWDFPTRAFHWSLVALVAFSGVSGEFGEDLPAKAMDLHQWSGLAILALLVFRLAWGFVGGTYARFASFVRGPGAVAGYLAELAGRRPGTAHLGHNPLGGWSVIALLATLALQVGTGLFIADEDLGVEGPLAKHVSARVSDTLADLHEGSFAVLLTLIAVHLSAIVFYAVVERDNLVRPMLTGVKRLPAAFADRAARGGHALLGAAVFAAAAAAVWVLITRA